MQIIVYEYKNSYTLFGESTDLKDYPTIPVGANVFIVETKEMFLKTDDETFVRLSPAVEKEPEEAPEETPAEDPVTEPEVTPEEETEEPEAEPEAIEE